MLFKRAEPASMVERLRVAMWPRRSWRRSMRYIFLRVRRISGGPHAVALGLAAGVFAACLPAMGFQMIAAALIAVLLGGSVIASAFGTFLANPLTYPLIWISTYKLGSLLLGESGRLSAGEIAARMRSLWRLLFDGRGRVGEATFDLVWPVLKPMSVGAVPLGLAAAAICYYIARRAVETDRTRRGSVETPAGSVVGVR